MIISKIKYFIVVIIVCFAIEGKAQVFNASQVKASYLVNFIKHINWNEELGIKAYKIGIIGEDSVLFDLMTSYSQKYRINGLIMLVNKTDIESLSSFNVIYVCNSEKDKAKVIYESINNHTLLVTDEYDDIDYSMINIYKSNSKILFKINPINTQNRDFELNARLVSYLIKSKDELIKIAVEAEVENQRLHQEQSLQKELIIELKNDLNQKTQEVESLKKDVAFLSGEIEKLKRKLNVYRSDNIHLDEEKQELLADFESQQMLLEEKKIILKQREEDIKRKEEEMRKQQKQLVQQEGILKMQNAEIQENQLEIFKQKRKLESQGDAMAQQRKVLFLTITLIALMIFSTFFTLRGLRIKKKANLKLQEKNRAIEEQKQEIIQKSDEIKRSEEELMIINESLVFQKDSLDRKNKEVQKQAEMLKARNNKIKEQTEELRITNDSLASQKEELEEANALKDRMFSIIGHDLRGPIGNFRSFLDLLLRQDDYSDTESIKRVLSTMLKSAGATFNLLENLLMWARNQRGAIEMNPEIIELNELFENNIHLLSQSANAKNITLENELDDELFAYCDENMINTVIRNLISNAIKFTPQDGTITLSAFFLNANSFNSENKRVEICIEDTGLGISQENIDKILSKKTTFTTNGTNNEKGSGLGLMLVQDFISRNNGTFTVESELGKGSRFIFTLPIFAS